MVYDKQYVRYSCRSKFKELNVMTLPSLYIYESVLYIKTHKHKTNNNTIIHSHNTRQKHDIHLHQTHSHIMEKGCYISAGKIFNHLPQNLKECASNKEFKQKLKKFLIQNEFYSLQEYFVKNL